MHSVGAGRFLSISFFREKAFPCRLRVRKIFDLLAETGEGGSGGGACFPVHQLVKTFFDKLTAPKEPVGKADGHLLPRVLATNLGTIDSSSRILRGLTVGAADSSSANAQRGRGAIFVNLIFPRKSVSLQAPRPKNLRSFSGDW